MVNAQVLYAFSFTMKEIGSVIGTESRLERSKGESRQDNIHLEAGNSLISNNNEGEAGFKTVLIACLSFQGPVLNKSSVHILFRK